MAYDFWSRIVDYQNCDRNTEMGENPHWAVVNARRNGDSLTYQSDIMQPNRPTGYSLRGVGHRGRRVMLLSAFLESARNDPCWRVGRRSINQRQTPRKGHVKEKEGRMPYRFNEPRLIFHAFRAFRHRIPSRFATDRAKEKRKKESLLIRRSYHLILHARAFLFSFSVNRSADTVRRPTRYYP